MSFLTSHPGGENKRVGFVGDFLSREHVLPGGIKLDASTFVGADAILVNVTTIAAANATSIVVTALLGDIPSGTLLDFGTTKFARTTAIALKGATTIAVAALPTALAVSDKAYYLAPGLTKRVPAGTLVGLTNTEYESASATGVKWGAAADADDVVRLIAYDVPDVNVNNDADVLRVGTLIKVNHLPDWTSLSSTLKGKIRSTYEVTVGTPGQEVAAS